MPANRGQGLPILHLALGGTIACVESPRGRIPRLAAKELLRRVEVPRGVGVRPVDLLQRTVVFPDDWTALATRIFEERERCRGFVVTLGTDTLAWVAAALELALPRFPLPIVLTGAMEPFGAPGGDARRNLEGAIRIATRGEPGVFVAFGGRIVEGRRASKVSSEGCQAFDSIGAPPIGRVDGQRVRWLRATEERGEPGKTEIFPRFDSRVATLLLEPQSSPEDLAPFARFRGLLLLGFGDGNVANGLVPALRRLAGGRLVVLGTRCGRGGVAHRYEGGRALVESGVLSAGPLTNELASVGICWALGQERRIDRARERFRTIAGGG
jgi:L-asparaginase